MIAAGILPEKARVCLRAGELIDKPAEGALLSDVKSALIQSTAAQTAGKLRIGAPRKRFMRDLGCGNIG